MTMALERPAAPGRTHRFAVRVHWEDTDAAGIVYYANYLRFIERGRSALVRDAGIDQRALLAEPGLTFQVRRCEVDYLAPAVLDDALTVVTALGAVGGATLDLGQQVRRGDALLVDARVRLACVDRGGRPRRVPAGVRRILADWRMQVERD